MKARSKKRQAYVTAARAEYVTNEIEIDDDPRISPSDGHAMPSPSVSIIAIGTDIIARDNVDMPHSKRVRAITVYDVGLPIM